MRSNRLCERFGGYGILGLCRYAAAGSRIFFTYRFQPIADDAQRLLLPDNTMRYGWLVRLTDFPRAIKNITLLPAAWGEKNSVTSSSKNVRPEAPRPWA